MQQQPMTSASVTPPDRGTSFVAVEGGQETRSGETLLVSAYATLWVILLLWIGSLWKKQAKLDKRVDGLEAAIERASKKPSTNA